jgi:hypothetical protein
MTLDQLKQFLDKTVVLRMTDGERATVRVRLVDEEYADVIVDVLETSSPERYKDRSAAYAIAAPDVASAELLKS